MYPDSPPWLTTEWAIFFLDDMFSTFVPWIIQNRGHYDILVHPNSGCLVEDHSSWALWGGNKWDLDLTEFGNEPWKPKNPNVKFLLADKENSFLAQKYIEEHNL
jgi:hypothetical protein